MFFLPGMKEQFVYGLANLIGMVPGVDVTPWLLALTDGIFNYVSLLGIGISLCLVQNWLFKGRKAKREQPHASE